ncbi:hypothetical protein A2U01_0003853 [Trifolium medium]|uniref:Uncharacterized protein n=1 Tax=Trifolium medium TaxID=97028 RepID=A0A392M734_9FABA|nr:hypothetical protein [Trifolium medium]
MGDIEEAFAQSLSLGEASIRTSLQISSRDQKKTKLTSDSESDSTLASDADVSLQFLSSGSETSEVNNSEFDQFRF